MLPLLALVLPLVLQLAGQPVAVGRQEVGADRAASRFIVLAYTTAGIITTTKPVIITDFRIRAVDYVRAMAAPHLGQVKLLQGSPRRCGS